MGCLAPNQMNSNCLLLGHTIGFVSLKKIQCQHCFTLLATAWAMDSQPFNLERALRGFLLVVLMPAGHVQNPSRACIEIEWVGGSHNGARWCTMSAAALLQATHGPASSLVATKTFKPTAGTNY